MLVNTALTYFSGATFFEFFFLPQLNKPPAFFTTFFFLCSFVAACNACPLECFFKIMFPFFFLSSSSSSSLDSSSPKALANKSAPSPLSKSKRTGRLALLIRLLMATKFKGVMSSPAMVTNTSPTFTGGL